MLMLFHSSIWRRAFSSRPPGWPVALLSIYCWAATAAELDILKLPPPVHRSVDFVKDVEPLFVANCYSCHGPEKQKNGLRLDNKDDALRGGDNGAVIVPGNSAASRLIQLIAGVEKDLIMPQKGERLTPEQIGLLRAWIDQGARWPAGLDPASFINKRDHWAFKPVDRPDVPAVKNHRWPRNPIDNFIFARLEKDDLSPAPEADHVTLIRQLNLDLIGLPPTPDEVRDFVRDPGSDAYEKLVERLLASPHYGERWARHWLDVVRFAESHGFEMNQTRPNAWPYRDYVIRSLNEDKPYNQFVVEQLAGDAVGADEATGFIVGGPWDQVKSPDINLTAQQRMDELHDMVSTTGSTFLGLTVGCARCHNHKFDPISQVDYYAMQAVFAGVQHGERSRRPPDYDNRMAQAENLRKVVVTLDAQLTHFELLADPTLAPATNYTIEAGLAPGLLQRVAGRPKLRPAVHPRLNVDRFAPTEARSVRFTVFETTDAEPCLDELEIYPADGNPRNVALASLGAKVTASGTYPNSDIHKLEHLNDGKLGNSFSWISNERGKGWVQVDFPEKIRINKVVWSRDREEKFSDRLATNYKIEIANRAAGQWTVVAASNDRESYVPGTKPKPNYSPAGLTTTELDQLNQLLAEKRQLEMKIKELTTFPALYAGKFEPPGPTYRLQRGEALQKREPVAPGVIKAFGAGLSLPAEVSDQQRRLALAEWIANPENPFTARVMVNRIWQHHFGHGLVDTPSDFGLNGARPSHPELLDWLASEFVARGWSVKAIHRLILESSTYRQSSEPNPQGLERDASDRLLWRFPPRRLEAEPLRDSILSVCGNLDLKMGGPGFDLFEPNNNYVKVYNPKKEFGPPEWRRMVYQAKPRMQLDDTFGTFDCPDAGQIAPQRTSSTTPLQALNLLNSPFMVEQAEIFSQRLRKDAGAEPSAQVRRAFWLTFCREPTRPELEQGERLVAEHGLMAFCRAILNANEFVFVF